MTSPFKAPFTFSIPEDISPSPNVFKSVLNSSNSNFGKLAPLKVAWKAPETKLTTKMISTPNENAQVMRRHEHESAAPYSR